MVDFTLTEGQKMLQKAAHDFAENEIRSVIKEFDRKTDPRDAIPWGVIKKGLKLGFADILIPEKYGGYGGGWLDCCIVAEELAWGDTGVATAIAVQACDFPKGLEHAKEAVREKWFRIAHEINQSEGDDLFLQGSCLTEPTGGTEIFCPLPDPALGMRTTAVRDGDEYVINGQKCFATNGGHAKLYMVFARTDTTKPNFESLSSFLVPADIPGVTIGKIEDKMGHRGCENAEVFFENVRIPAENLLGEEGQASECTEEADNGFGLLVGAAVVGLARAAYEEALKYANERVIWGQPIRQYETVLDKLVDMRMKIEACRALIWKLAWAMDHPEESGGLDKLAIMGKVFPTSLIRGMTIDALHIFGGYGYMRDAPMEKYVRDAMVMPIYHATNEIRAQFLNFAL